MAAMQSMCARIGRVTGKGLAANIKATFPPIVLQGVVLLLLIANTLNIAADVAAMGEVAELVTGFNRHLMTGFFVFATLLLQVFVPYHRYVFFLKWLTVSLLAYAAVLFTVHVPWGEVALRTVWPKFTPNSDTAAVIVGVFGTTISPYLFFLGGIRRGRGHAVRTRRFTARARCERGTRGTAPDRLGYLERHALLGSDGLLHHPGNRRHAPRGGS
jgi:Mn2+/Fe2+ NRAMP family transporter